MHVRCLRFLRVLRAAAPSFLSVRPNNEYTGPRARLPSLVGHILEDATKSGQVIVRNKITGAEESVCSNLLARVNEAIIAFFAAEQGVISDLGSLHLSGGGGVC